MNLDMQQFLSVFFEEADEHLASMEALLLVLDPDMPDSEALHAIFRAAHSIKGSSGMFGFDDVTRLTHVLETDLDLLRSGRAQLTRPMIDLFFEARDMLAVLIACRRDGVTLDDDGAIDQMIARLQQIMTVAAEPASPAADMAAEADDSFGFFDPEPAADADDAYGFFEPLPEASPSVETPAASSPAPATVAEVAGADGADSTAASSGTRAEAYGFFDKAPGAPQPGSAPKPAAPPPARAASDSDNGSIRVNVRKIDSLINLVGEMVIIQSMLAQQVGELGGGAQERLQQAMNQFEHNTRDLQEAVMSIRMMPISFVFSRFPRLVRDVCGKLGKQVDLVLLGEHTELDKGLIERLIDPLTHLVRNSIDHGIESPAERLATGKPEMGTVQLAAYHQGGRVVVEIADDGRGLSRDKILAKARQQGLPAADSMTDAEVWQLIFLPGFSTAEQVTDLSGRGVGMDVVRRNIQSAGGKIDILSTAGQGTRITIRLPLTLAILDGMIVSVAGIHYVIPLTYIVESLHLGAAELRSLQRHEQVVRVRDDYLPVLAMSDLLQHGEPTARDKDAVIVIVETDEQRLALLVDQLVGQQQVVIKSLEQNFRRIDGIAGATIMGDGSVAMILDVDQLPGLMAREQISA